MLDLHRGTPPRTWVKLRHDQQPTLTPQNLQIPTNDLSNFLAWGSVGWEHIHGWRSLDASAPGLSGSDSGSHWQSRLRPDSSPDPTGSACTCPGHERCLIQCRREPSLLQIRHRLFFSLAGRGYEGHNPHQGLHVAEYEVTSPELRLSVVSSCIVDQNSAYQQSKRKSDAAPCQAVKSSARYVAAESIANDRILITLQVDEGAGHVNPCSPKSYT